MSNDALPRYNLNSPVASYVLGGLQLGLVLVLSGPALWSLFHHTCIRRKDAYQPLDGLYEDEDGQASEKSQHQYSTYPAQVVALLASATGWTVALIAALFQVQYGSTAFATDSLLRLASWLVLIFQAVGVFVERDPVARFDRAVLAMLSSAFVFLELAAVSLICISWQKPHDLASKLYIAMPAVQAGLSFICVITFGLIQRRPHVFDPAGAPIDAEWTVSFWARYTYSWAVPLLTYAGKNKKLTLDEVPRLSDYSRANTLQKAYFEGEVEGRRLWKEIVIYFRWGFVKQVVLISIVSFTQFIPQLVMYNLLQLLEQREQGAQIKAQAWLWVVGLLVSMLISSWIESYLFWYVVMYLSEVWRTPVESP